MTQSLKYRIARVLELSENYGALVSASVVAYDFRELLTVISKHRKALQTVESLRIFDKLADFYKSEITEALALSEPLVGIALADQIMKG